jgi:hypothetical protein
VDLPAGPGHDKSLEKSRMGFNREGSRTSAIAEDRDTKEERIKKADILIAQNDFDGGSSRFVF